MDGGLIGFELKGGREAGRRFIDALKMFYHVANIDDDRSSAIHPATTTHSQLSPEEQLQTGVTRTMSGCRSGSSTRRISSPIPRRRSTLLDPRILPVNAGAAVSPAAHDFAA